MRLAPSPAALLCALALLTVPGCNSWRLGDPVLLRPAEPTERARERAARKLLEDARSLHLQGKRESAERVARRGLELQPDDARLHRLLARVLEEQGRSEETEAQRRRADELDPPPPPPPDETLEAPSRGLVALLLPPLSQSVNPDRLPGDWPDGIVAETLERRLRVRVPEARIVHADPASVSEAAAKLASLEARAALSLQVVRAYCDVSVKDGHFAVVVLRTSAEVAGAPGSRHERVRAAVDDPPRGRSCPAEATARALEAALTGESLARALAARPDPGTPWSRASLRALFPGLGVRIREDLGEGQRWLGSGHLALAEESFARAARVDPADPDVVTYLAEVRSTLAMVGELDPANGHDPTLPPRFSDRQRANAEAQLAAERRRRENLLAALAVLDEDVRPPGARTLAVLRAAPIQQADAFGPTRARAGASGPVEARIAYAPDGSVLSRYYFALGATEPVLREEDTSGDGRADRWISYDAGARREIFEDSRGRGQPDVRIVFATGGTELERIEIDANLDGRPERVFRYAAGHLRVESRDTTDDGVLDRFDRFDDRGEVVMREEDRDGDGRIDVRSIYRAGKLVRREFSDPDAVPDDT